MRGTASNPLLAIAAVCATLQPGCGILIGNVKPVTQRSGDYGVRMLTEDSEEWTRLIPESDDEADSESRDSDLAFQSKKTASIISMSSSCRERIRTETRTLREYTALLILGMTDVDSRIERAVKIDGQSGLQTTFKGNLGGERMTIRTVVLRRQHCIYDIVYISRPHFFDAHEATFDRFVSSVRFH